jgi:drug/metabolite transporter (DMT)-like permease
LSTPAGDAWKVHAALWIVQVAFASQAVEGKLLMADVAAGGGGVDPVALVMARTMGAAIFFTAFTGLRGKLKETTTREKLALLGLSALGITFNQTLFLVGLKLTSSTAAALMSVTIPIITAGLAVAMRIERPSVALGLGLSLAVVGIVCLTGVKSIDRGVVVLIINALCYSSYLVLSRRLIQKLGALTVVTWLFVFGALSLAPFGVPALVANAPHWSARTIALVAYIVAMPSIVAYLANAWALARATPSLVTIYVSVQPILAALLAWVQLGTPLTKQLAVAGAFILAGVAVVVARPTSASPET